MHFSKLTRQRPYCVECTGSLPNSEVKPRKARIVLGWVTAREVLRVLLTFLSFYTTHPGWWQQLFGSMEPTA